MQYEDRTCGEMIISRNNKKYAFDADTGKYAMIEGANPKWPDYTGELKVNADGDDGAAVLLRVSAWARRRKTDGQGFFSCKVAYDRKEARRLSVSGGKPPRETIPSVSASAEEIENLPF